jgi:hypothetical protein
MAASTPASGSSGASSGTPAEPPPKPHWDPVPGHPRPAPWLRPTIRIRLTLLYGGMFLIAGMVLLALIYSSSWSVSKSARTPSAPPPSTSCCSAP